MFEWVKQKKFVRADFLQMPFTLRKRFAAKSHTSRRILTCLTKNFPWNDSSRYCLTKGEICAGRSRLPVVVYIDEGIDLCMQREEPQYGNAHTKYGGAQNHVNEEVFQIP